MTTSPSSIYFGSSATPPPLLDSTRHTRIAPKCARTDSTRICITCGEEKTTWHWYEFPGRNPRMQWLKYFRSIPEGTVGYCCQKCYNRALPKIKRTCSFCREEKEAPNTNWYRDRSTNDIVYRCRKCYDAYQKSLKKHSEQPPTQDSVETPRPKRVHLDEHP